MPNLQRRSALLAFGAALFGSACRRRRGPSLTIGAETENETLILAEIIAAWVGKRLEGSEFTRRYGLGEAPLQMEAMLAGQIDVCPEYAGIGFRRKIIFDTGADRELVRERLKEAYRRQLQCEWIGPLGFDNRFVAVVTRAKAEQLGIRTLSEAALPANGWVLGARRDYAAAKDGLPQFLGQTQLYQKRSHEALEEADLYRALDDGRVDIVIGRATDGQLSDSKYVALEDDLLVHRAEEAGIAVRLDALSEAPALAGTLNALTGKIPFAAMQSMNRQVTVEGKKPETVAATFVGTLS